MSPGETCSDLPARNARTLGAPTLERGSDEVAGNLIVLIDLMIVDDRSHAPAWERRPRRSSVPR